MTTPSIRGGWSATGDQGGSIPINISELGSSDLKGVKVYSEFMSSHASLSLVFIREIISFNILRHKRAISAKNY